MRQPRTAGSASSWLKRNLPIALAVMLFCASTASKADENQVTEHRIKAAFLYNFSRFVDWPGDIPHPDRFTICVLGVDPFGDVIDSLAGKAVHGNELEILRLAGSKVAEICRVVYISESESDRIDSILASLGNRPVLTISDSADFARQGGIIRLKLIDKKVRFDINIDAAQRAGLSISSKLLSLATIVRDSSPEDAQ